MKGFNIQKKINKDDNSKKHLIAEAFKFHSQGNIQEAIKYYQLFIDRGLSDPVMFSNYGVLCKQLGKIDQAIELYTKSIDLFPNNPNSYINLANILQEEKKLNQLEKLKVVSLVLKKEKMVLVMIQFLYL